MSWDVEADWKKFRELIRNSCGSFLQKEFREIRADTWVFECYDDINAFADRYPTAEERDSILEYIEESKLSFEKCRLILKRLPIAKSSIWSRFINIISSLIRLQ